MTRHQKRLAQAVALHLDLKEALPLVEQLLHAGLINLTEAERLAIRQHYATALRQGVGCCQAMVNLSEEFGCSYEKIRKIIYQKP